MSVRTTQFGGRTVPLTFGDGVSLRVRSHRDGSGRLLRQRKLRLSTPPLENGKLQARQPERISLSYTLVDRP